jgi:hypothetical protein
MGEVVDIRPKTINRTYKKHKYTVSFIPATKKWKWEVEVVNTIRYCETADTQIKAFRAAEKFIDQTCKTEKVG